MITVRLGVGLDCRRRSPRLHPTMPDRNDRYGRRKPLPNRFGNFAGNQHARRPRQRRSRHGAQRAMLHEQPGLGFSRGIARPLTANGAIATRLIQDEHREQSRQQDVAQQCDESERSDPRSAASIQRSKPSRFVERRCHPVTNRAFFPCRSTATRPEHAGPDHSVPRPARHKRAADPPAARVWGVGMAPGEVLLR